MRGLFVRNEAGQYASVILEGQEEIADGLRRQGLDPALYWIARTRAILPRDDEEEERFRQRVANALAIWLTLPSRDDELTTKPKPRP